MLLDIAACRSDPITSKSVALSPVVSIHVNAFVKHSRWLPRLQQWCIMIQAAMVDEIMSVTHPICAANNVRINVEGLSLKWRNSESGAQIRKLCLSIARGMTIVNKRFHHPISEKKHPAFLSLASGELAPVVLEMVSYRNDVDRSKPPSVISENNDVSSTLSTSSSATSTPSFSAIHCGPSTSTHPTKLSCKRTLLDYLKINDSPSSSDLEDVTVPTATAATLKAGVQATAVPISHSSLTKPWTKTFNGRQFEFFAHRKRRDVREAETRRTGSEFTWYY